jgi:hypothetical protein
LPEIKCGVLSFVTTAGSSVRRESRRVMGAVSAGEIATRVKTAAYPTFLIRTRPPPSGRKTRLTVPVAVVLADHPVPTSKTSAPSIG